MREALATFGEEDYYGLESVELMPAPPAGGRLVFGELVGPGQFLIRGSGQASRRKRL